LSPALNPTISPSLSPTFSPALNPTISESNVPTISPTDSTEELEPTLSPSLSPTSGDTDESLLPTFSPSIDTDLVNPNGDPTLSPLSETDPKPTDDDRDVSKPIISSKGGKSSGYSGKSGKANSDLNDEGILEIEIDMSYDLLEEGSKSGKFVDGKVLFNGKSNKGPETEITYVLKPKAIKSNKESDNNITFINTSKAGKVSKASTVMNSTGDVGYAKAGKVSKGAKAALNSTMLNVTRLTKAGKVSKSSKAGSNSTVQNVTSLTYAKSGKVSNQMGNVSSLAISKSSKDVLITIGMSVPIMLVNPETSKQLAPSASKVDDIPIRTSGSNNTDEVFDSDVVQIKPTSIPTDAPSLQTSKSYNTYEDIELIGVVIPQKPPSQVTKILNTDSPTVITTPEDSIETTLFPTQELSMSILVSEPPTALPSSPPPTTPKVDDTESPTFMPTPDDSIETTLFPMYELSMPLMKMSMPPSSIPTSTYPNSKTAKHSDETDRAIPDSDTPGWAKGVSFDGYHVKNTEFQTGYNPGDHMASSSASVTGIYIALLSIMALLGIFLI